MRKISYILISGCITLSIIGCDETFDTSNTSEGILSLSENGLTILQSYNVGEKYNADLWIQHGGLELNNSTVTFTVDKSLLDSLNTADGTSYQILPEDCYQMTNTTVNVSAGDRLAKGTIVYDPTKIHALCGYDNVQYILPLKASTTGEKLNPDRSTLLLGFKVSEPIVTIINDGIQEINVDNVKELPITIGVPFSNKWNINCTLVNNQSVVDTYNSANQTYFSLLPAECYTKPESPYLMAHPSTLWFSAIAAKCFPPSCGLCAGVYIRLPRTVIAPAFNTYVCIGAFSLRTSFWLSRLRLSL